LIWVGLKQRQRRSSSLSIWVHPLLHLIQWYLLPLVQKSLFLTIDNWCPFLFLLPAHRWPLLHRWSMAAGSLSSNLRSRQIHGMFLIYTCCIMSPRIYIYCLKCYVRCWIYLMSSKM
jgi:hypothetical protein